MNLPCKRVNGSRINRLGVNTNHVICRSLIGVGHTYTSNDVLGGGRIVTTCRCTGDGNGDIRLVKLASSNNIRSSLRRLFALYNVSGACNVRGACMRYFVSNHSASPGDNGNFVRRLRTRYSGAKYTVTSVINHFCTVSHSGH